MSDNWTLVICRTPPSANVLLRYHWAQRARLLDDWSWLVKAACNEQHVEPCDKLQLDCKIYYRTNRKRDMDNVEYGVKKIVQDVLVRIGIVKDDSPEYITWNSVSVAHDKIDPRTELIVYEVSQ